MRINPIELIKIGVLQSELGITPDTDTGEPKNDDELEALKQKDFTAYLDKKYPGGKLPKGWEFADDGPGDNKTAVAIRARV